MSKSLWCMDLDRHDDCPYDKRNSLTCSCECHDRRKPIYPDIIELNVTQKDIDKAVKVYPEAINNGYWAQSCPISQALKRLYPDTNIVTTGRVKIKRGISSPIFYDNDNIAYFTNKVDTILFNNKHRPSVHPSLLIKPIHFTLRKV